MPQSNRYDFLMFDRGGIVVFDPVGTLVALLLVIVVAIFVSNSRIPTKFKQLIYLALAFRVIGAAARYIVLFAVYGGSGDARGYYRLGLEYAAALWAFNPGPLFDPDNWFGGRWWGTQFVYFPTTLVHMFVGESMPGGFLVFSMLAFAGLCGFVIAFARTYPHVPVSRYARWVFLFPALWFWPSSIGKEAIVLLGTGMVIAGYIGRNNRINWLLLLAGGFIVFGIRAQVAAVLIVSLLIAHWLSLISDRWTFRNTMQAIVVFGAGIVGLYVSMPFIGIESFDIEGVQTYMEGELGREVGGGSVIEAAPVSLAGVPISLVNILFRPFIWESGSLTVFISCVEIMAMWAIILYRRKTVASALRFWRHDRLLRVAVPFILIYSISLGMVVANIGIIARQRIFIFPFLFFFLEAIPRRSLATRPQKAVARSPRPQIARRRVQLPEPTTP